MSTQRRKTSPGNSAPQGMAEPPENGGFKFHALLESAERTFLPVGSEIGKYRIIEEIDRGGMAVVYKALQLDLDRIVALKILPANITINRRFVERFLSEAHAVAKLAHPGIVNIYEVSMENNIYFLAMEHIPGKNLFHYLHQQKPKLVEVLEIFVKLADALAYAHGKRIVHRDLKLNNVIMRDRNTPVLIDFGLAKTLEEDEGGITRTGEVMGSPAYMAAERIQGKAGDSRSDICSLGIMLYEMLTFKNPYLDPRSIHQTTLNVIAADPVPPRKLVPWLPLEVEAITLKAMHREPSERYQTMAEFGDDIQRYQRGEQVLASPPSSWSKLIHYARKHWSVLSIATTVVLFTLLLSGLLYLQSIKERSHWQQVLHETFDDTASITDWTPAGALPTLQDPQRQWHVDDSSLAAVGDSSTSIRFVRPYARDVKIEFDIIGQGPDLFSAGLFMGGNQPDSAYCFVVHSRGTAECGITFPGSRFLFHDYNPLEFPVDNHYHVEVEKAEGVISFRLNGILIGRIHDYWPLLGKDHQNIGFFADNCATRFDDLKVYRRAMPLLTKPTIIADRLFEHGSITSALEEYRELLLDISRRAIVRRIKFRIAECLIRLNELRAADRALNDPDLTSDHSIEDQAHHLYLRAVLHKTMGDAEGADRLLHRLSTDFPGNPLNYSVLLTEVNNAIVLLDSGRVAETEERLNVLTNRYPRHTALIAKAHFAVLEHVGRAAGSREILDVGYRILAAYPKEEDILARTRTLIGRALLGKRRKQAAVDMFNQCIGTYNSLPGVWEAWMALGEVYEFDRNYGDALSVYAKIYDECPRTIPLSWMAGIRMGEAAYQSGTASQPPIIFKDVAGGQYPFPEVRLIAQFYSGERDSTYFVRRWQHLHPGNQDAHFFLAKRALFERRRNDALLHLEELLATLPQDSWSYLRAFSLKSEIEKR